MGSQDITRTITGENINQNNIDVCFQKLFQ